MTSLPFFQVDAFADRPFTGNPAAVMPLDDWLPDEVLQAIAVENNLAETAFTVPTRRGEADYELRWFTPTVEVALCGHATLASGACPAQPASDPLCDPVGSADRDPRRRLAVARPAGGTRRARRGTRAARGARASRARRRFLGRGGNGAAHRCCSTTKRRCAPSRPISPRFAQSTGWSSVTAPGDRPTSSAGCSPPITASTRTRSPARRMPRWCPSGPSGSAAPASPRSRRASAAAASNASIRATA